MCLIETIDANRCVSNCISPNLQNNIQQHIPHWRWKRWYETWLCIRQIGQIKSKEASSSTRASTMALNTYYSLSSWLSHFTTLLVVLSVMPFGKYDFHLSMLDNVNELMRKMENIPVSYTHLRAHET